MQRAGGPADARRFHEKIDRILRQADEPAPAPRRTVITEPEVNAYLAGDARTHLPPSVTRPLVMLLGEGRLSASAVVDLDVVRLRSSGGWLDPAAWLSGRLPVSAVGVVTSAQGSVRLRVERVEIGGMPVPPALLQELVSVYTRSAEAPRGVRLDEPFALPAAIERIEVERGHAVVVQ